MFTALTMKSILKQITIIFILILCVSGQVIRSHASEPICTGVDPSFGLLGMTMDVTITGSGTHFNETSQVSFSCKGVTVNSVTANSATKIVANITIATDAPSSKCDVTVTTGSEVIICTEAFSVGCVGCLSCIEVTPATASAGETMDVIIRLSVVNVSTAENVGVTFGCAGITVNSVTATSTTELKTNITVACNAPQCTGDVTISGGPSGSAGIICVNAFTVNAPPPCPLTVEPTSLRAGFLFPRLHLITIKSPNANFNSESIIETENIRILKVLETEPNQIRAVVLIPPKYQITKGMKQIKITTDTEGLCPEVCNGEIEIK